jgi:hypothetical protein
MPSSDKYKLLLIFGVVISTAMLGCAVYVKSVPLMPFVLLNGVVLHVLGNGFTRATGASKKVLGRYFGRFVAVFGVFGLAAILLRPGIV